MTARYLICIDHDVKAPMRSMRELVVFTKYTLSQDGGHQLEWLESEGINHYFEIVTDDRVARFYLVIENDNDALLYKMRWGFSPNDL